MQSQHPHGSGGAFGNRGVNGSSRGNQQQHHEQLNAYNQSISGNFASGGAMMGGAGQQQQVPIHGGGMGTGDSLMGNQSQRSYRGADISSNHSPGNIHNSGNMLPTYDIQMSPSHFSHRMSLGGFYPMSAGAGSATSPGANFLMGDSLDLSGRSISSTTNNAQADREEELLLNLLIARRQRGRISGDKSGRGSQASLADELVRLRQNRAAAAQRNSLPPLPGMPPLFDGTSNAGVPPNMYAGVDYRKTNMRNDMSERIDRVPTRFAPVDARMDLSDRSMTYHNRSGSMMMPHTGSMMMGMSNPGMMMGSGYDQQAAMYGAYHHGSGVPMPHQHGANQGENLESNSPKKKRAHKKKPADMPRRPLSAYNLFFSEERERILKEIEDKESSNSPTTKAEDDELDEETTNDLKKANEEDEEEKPKALLRPLIPSQKKRRPHRKTHGKISFQQLARMVGERWKALPEDKRQYYKDLAEDDMKRQKVAMEEYYAKQNDAKMKEIAVSSQQPGELYKQHEHQQAPYHIQQAHAEGNRSHN